MLCYVTRPDSVVMEVEVDAKANGEDCLNKVRLSLLSIRRHVSPALLLWSKTFKPSFSSN